jgi:hypothetical protein
MAKYIEREALPKEKERGFFEADYFNAGWNACLSNIESIPDADVRPVVRARWITPPKNRDYAHMIDYYECPLCGFIEDYLVNFCPNCGADMRPQQPKIVKIIRKPRRKTNEN